MAPTTAGPPVRNPKMARERSGSPRRHHSSVASGTSGRQQITLVKRTRSPSMHSRRLLYGAKPGAAPPGLRRFVSGVTAHWQDTSRQTIEGGRSPTVHLAGGNCRAHTPAGTAAPGPSLRAPRLRRSFTPGARGSCHVPAASSLYSHGQPSAFLIVPEGVRGAHNKLGQRGSPPRAVSGAPSWKTPST